MQLSTPVNYLSHVLSSLFYTNIAWNASAGLVRKRHVHIWISGYLCIQQPHVTAIRKVSHESDSISQSPVFTQPMNERVPT